MTVATFSSSLISGSTRSNEIDEKIMLLLENIVRLLAQDTEGGGTWDTDHEVLAPIFDWYETSANKGYFSTARMRGSATANGIRIRDMVNNEEFRITVADVGGAPTLKVQHYSGAEVESPSWNEVLSVNTTSIRHAGGFVNALDSHNVEAYIDSEIARLEALISAGSGGIVSVTGTNVILATTDGGGAVTVGVNPNGGNGQSVQMYSGAPAWRDQAVPAHAHVYGNAAISGMAHDTYYQADLSAIADVRGGLTVNADAIDIVTTGVYLINVNLMITQSNGVTVPFGVAIFKNGVSSAISTNEGRASCPNSQFASANVSTIAYLTSADNVMVGVRQSTGSGGINITAVPSVDIVRLS